MSANIRSGSRNLPGRRGLDRIGSLARVVTIAGAAMLVAPALAKLPPPSAEAKAVAAESAAKAAWDNKVGLYQLCKAIDRTADAYRNSAKAAGKDMPPATATPDCADPGAYVSPITSTASKPLEASGAHSPPQTAVSPPSSKATAAEIAGNPKK